MPQVAVARATHRTQDALASHPALIAYVLLGFAFCVVSCLRVFDSKRRKYSPKQLAALRDWRDGRAETKVESSITRMQDKLASMKRRRRVEAGRDAHEALLDEAEARRDARGREVYGDEWDAPAADGVPIHDLFALSDGEVRQLQLEARNKQALRAAKKLELVEKATPRPPPGPPPLVKKPPPPPGPPPGVYPFAPRPPEIPAATRFVSTPREAFGAPAAEAGGTAVEQLRARLAAPRRRGPPPGPPPRGPPPPERTGPGLV
jgi:hypothetical protein